MKIGNGWNGYTFAGITNWRRYELRDRDIIARDDTTGDLWLDVTSCAFERAEEPDVPLTNQQIYQRYVWAGMTRDAATLAEMFTADGVLETPLVSAGGPYPRRLEGREEIRRAMAAYYERSATGDRTVNVDKSRYLLHTTTDPDVFIVEIDTVFDSPAGPSSMSLVQIFRLRDDKIALLRDYFAPEEAA
ncbi:nuclear transport factor 2 family protein [Nonomuraea sp. KM88]|uniref:nuclear transport factor 2 family protein n=1 Tax=Nonomuraea sp. KM88 TaxID=3457427 RepID=UPI003FCC781A